MPNRHDCDNGKNDAQRECNSDRENPPSERARRLQPSRTMQDPSGGNKREHNQPNVKRRTLKPGIVEAEQRWNDVVENKKSGAENRNPKDPEHDPDKTEWQLRG